MISSEAALGHALSHALGWTLLHFLWQGALAALLLAVVLTLLRGRRPEVRYAAACSALALMLLMPAVTFWRMSGSAHLVGVDETTLTAPPSSGGGTASGRLRRPAERPGETDGDAEGPLRRRLLSGRIDSLLPWLTLAWLLGVLALTARALGGLFCARRLTRRANRPVEGPPRETLGRLSRRLRLTKPVRLVESALVRTPTAVGWLRPVILLPASALTGLTPRQLELILAHELAHVRRHDYLVNLFQVLAETLLFYHPAVWWISRQVRVEREQACDDLAVALCGDPVAYARALAKVERLRRETPLLAVAADGGNLGERVRRLVESSQGARRPSPLPGLLLVAGLLASSAGAAHGFLSHEDSPAAVAPPGEPSGHDSGHAYGSDERRGTPNLPPHGEDVARLIARDETAGEDAGMRRAAIGALGERAGTVVLMDPLTGRVYAVVNQEWALRRGWSPASTIKLVTGAAMSVGGGVSPSERVRVPGGARALDLTDALAVSDNSYFRFVAGSVGAGRIVGHAREFGLGERTGINYAGESAGSLPRLPAGGDASLVGAYGEGVEATPIQLAVLVSAVANGGRLVVPYVPREPGEGAHFEPQFRRTVRIPHENLERLRDGMTAAVSYGTARGASVPALRVAGKTGTYIEDGSPVGIFASYAPADDPRLVVVVITRGKGENGPAAAGVAGAIYRALGGRGSN